MRMWSWIAAAFIVLVLQTTSLGCFGGNLFFDLPLLFIYSVGLFYGARGRVRLHRGLTIALNAEDRFSMLLAAGITGMYLFHVLVNTRLQF